MSAFLKRSRATVASRNQTIVTPLMTAERRPKKVDRVSSGIRSAIHRHQPDVPRLAKSQLTARARRMACAPATLLPPCATPRATAAGTKPSTRCAVVTTIQKGLTRRSRPKMTMDRRLNTEAKLQRGDQEPEAGRGGPELVLEEHVHDRAGRDHGDEQGPAGSEDDVEIHGPPRPGGAEGDWLAHFWMLLSRVASFWRSPAFCASARCRAPALTRVSRIPWPCGTPSALPGHPRLPRAPPRYRGFPSARCEGQGADLPILPGNAGNAARLPAGGWGSMASRRMVDDDQRVGAGWPAATMDRASSARASPLTASARKKLLRVFQCLGMVAQARGRSSSPAADARGRATVPGSGRARKQPRSTALRFH